MGTVRFAVSLAIILSTTVASAESWNQFRGPDASGVSENDQLPLEWGPGRNVAWKAEIPGSGWSSPVLAGDRIFLTTAVPNQPEEAPKAGLYFGGERKDAPKITYDWRVVAVSLRDGEILWEQSVKVGQPDRGKHIKNTYASETATTDGRRVYAYFGQAGVFALDLDGKLLWSKELGTYDTKAEWGTGSSPITDGAQVYVQCDNDDESFMVALDAESGKENWRVPRDEKTNWSTPFLWRTPDRVELVTAGRNRARSYDPATGELLWEIGGMSSIVVSTPFANDEYCFVSSGYVMDAQHRPIFAIKPNSSGDLTLDKRQTSSEQVAWYQRLGGSYMPTPICYQDAVYVLYDRSLFGAFHAKTGEELYSKKRIPNGGNFTASPWAYRGHIFCLSEDGQTFAIKAGEEFEIAHVNPPLDENIFMATPALAGDTLIIRGAKTLYGIRESAGDR